MKMSIAGIVLAVFSIGYNFYSDFTNASSRNLSYYYEFENATIFDKDYSENLSLRNNGVVITNDVSVYELVFLNMGKSSIEKGDILSPLTIDVSDGSRILESKITSKSRELIDVSLDKSNLNEGVLAFDWGILEFYDGFRVQVILERRDITGISVKCALRGQKEINFIETPWRSKNVNPFLSAGMSIVITLILLAALFMFSKYIFEVVFDLWGQKNYFSISDIAFDLGMLCICLYMGRKMAIALISFLTANNPVGF